VSKKNISTQQQRVGKYIWITKTGGKWGGREKEGIEETGDQKKGYHKSVGGTIGRGIQIFDWKDKNRLFVV